MFYDVYETANALKARIAQLDNTMLDDEAISKLALHIALGTTGTQSTSVYDSCYVLVKHKDKDSDSYSYEATLRTKPD